MKAEEGAFDTGTNPATTDNEHMPAASVATAVRDGWYLMLSAIVKGVHTSPWLAVFTTKPCSFKLYPSMNINVAPVSLGLPCVKLADSAWLCGKRVGGIEHRDVKKSDVQLPSPFLFEIARH